MSFYLLVANHGANNAELYQNIYNVINDANIPGLRAVNLETNSVCLALKNDETHLIRFANYVGSYTRLYVRNIANTGNVYTISSGTAFERTPLHFFIMSTDNALILKMPARYPDNLSLNYLYLIGAIKDTNGTTYILPDLKHADLPAFRYNDEEAYTISAPGYSLLNENNIGGWLIPARLTNVENLFENIDFSSCYGAPPNFAPIGSFLTLSNGKKAVFANGKLFM